MSMISQPMRAWMATLPGTVAWDHALARYTTWRIGGAAEAVYWPKDKEALLLFLEGWRRYDPAVPLTFLGLGSNVLISDAGLPGVVVMLHPALSAMGHEGDRLWAQAGVPLAKFARFAQTIGWARASFFAGIPGTIGGALAMNAGAFGEETFSSVLEVECFSRERGFFIADRSAFDVGYRRAHHPDAPFYLSATFQAQPGEADAIRHLLQKRNQTQPIGTYNCGSVFKNPEGGFAAAMIEACGLKGTRCGGALISPKHANFILNDDHASAEDCVHLMHKVQAQVWQSYGILLQPEVRFLGTFHARLFIPACTLSE